MNQILFVSGHTDLKHSVVNKTILTELQAQITNAKFDILDELYPNFIIDIKAEQKKLSDADIIVLQFPMFWYAMPSLMHKWMEDVFLHGFSHGSLGDKLVGKKLVASITTGALPSAYHKDSSIGYEIEEFLSSIQATCRLCKMEFVGYIHTGGVSYHDRNDDEKRKSMEGKAIQHANRLSTLLDKV